MCGRAERSTEAPPACDAKNRVLKGKTEALSAAASSGWFSDLCKLHDIVR